MSRPLVPRNAPISEHIYARDIRDVPLDAPITASQADYDRLEHLVFPNDVKLLYDHFRRGWTVGPAPEILILEALLQISAKLDRLLAK